MQVFTLDNYPKSYASIKKDDFRLKKFLHLNNEDLEELYKKLESFCITRSQQVQRLEEYSNLTFLAAGWEWSVFKKDENTVIKVPAGIFAEVNDPRYLENTEHAYHIIEKSFSANNIAETKFYRKNNLNVIEQQFVNGKNNFIIEYRTKDKELLLNFKKFLVLSLHLVESNDWLPDFWFTEKKEGIYIRNVILEDKTKLFKVFDFTQYFDPSRMYPGKTKIVVPRQVKRIQELVTWVDSQL
jgi:hypothetical protein